MVRAVERLEVVHAARLKCPIRRVPALEELEIDLVCVELRSVNARELRLAAHLDATPAAHPGPVDHDRIQRCDRLDPVGSGHFGDGSHHRNRSRREHDADIFGGDDVGECLRYESRPSVRTVVGAWNDFDTVGRELVLEQNVLPASSADDRNHPIAGIGEGARDRVGDRGSESTADDDCGAVLLDLRSASERTGHVDEIVSSLQLAHEGGRPADGLDEERDRPGVGIGRRNREWDAFTVRRDPHNHELAGQMLLRDLRCLDDDAADIGRNGISFDNQIHRHLHTQCGGPHSMRVGPMDGCFAAVRMWPGAGGSASRAPGSKNRTFDPSRLVLLPIR